MTAETFKAVPLFPSDSNSPYAVKAWSETYRRYLTIETGFLNSASAQSYIDSGKAIKAANARPFR
jgi:hypothetical protein